MSAHSVKPSKQSPDEDVDETLRTGQILWYGEASLRPHKADVLCL